MSSVKKPTEKKVAAKKSSTKRGKSEFNFEITKEGCGKISARSTKYVGLASGLPRKGSVFSLCRSDRKSKTTGGDKWFHTSAITESKKLEHGRWRVKTKHESTYVLIWTNAPALPAKKSMATKSKKALSAGEEGSVLPSGTPQPSPADSSK